MSDCDEVLSKRSPVFWPGILLAVVYWSAPALESAFKVIAMASAQDEAFMREAIKVMRDAGVVNKTGGPFGVVIVKDGLVIAAAGNSVIQDNDPSAHAREGDSNAADPEERSAGGVGRVSPVA